MASCYSSCCANPSNDQSPPYHCSVWIPLLPTTEEDPCACESIVRFEAKVEGLLQALTRKHILSQAGEGRAREGWGSTEDCGGMTTERSGLRC